MLKDRYQASFEYWTDANDGGWQDWFNPDIPSELAYPSETEFSCDVVAALLDAGEVMWNHPGWIRDLWALLEDWAIEGQLIHIRLVAQWLLTTLPPDPLDREVGDRLTQLARGEFCDAFPGLHSIWPHQEEFYRRTLQWRVVPYVRQWMHDMGLGGL